ncbi:hypothetical protein FRC06_001093 [Ceratobasidium sp. 370]|nr:hypothetical protein FRC06_001093 [Ceratobasidium sp. 370]
MSIKHLDQAVLLTTKEHSGLPKYLNNLASSLQIRSETLKGLHDLDRAIECLELAVALTPDENTDKPSWLSNLGVALMRRFDIVGAPVDINRAVDRQNRAVLLTPDTDTAKSVWLNNLGLSLASRFEHSRDMPDLDQAIIHLDQAVRLTSVDGAARTRWASNLGSALRTRFRHLNEDSDLKQSIEAFKEAAQSYQGDPLLRFTAACSWARLSSQANEPTSLEAYKLAMGLVPRIVWLGNTVEDRYRDIPAIRNVALEAAAIAIEFQAHDLAVEWLEEGRSIVWQQRLQILNPMEDLRRANHELAERLKNVAIQISLAEMAKQTVDISHDASSHEQSAQQHRRLAEKWDKLLHEARLLDGFDDFLQPKKLPWLTGAAHSGAVAIVNLHKKRADVLAILPNSTNVIHIPLHNFSYDHAVQLRDRLFGSLRHGNLPNRGDRRPVFHDEESDNAGFEDILASLWTQVVQPVFVALGYTERLPMDELPRLTWCTTGPLSFLPLHAAGCYDTPGPENRAFRYAITSYTPILAALIRPVPSPHDFRGVLAVGQSSTTGQLPLPGTVQEIEMIVKHVGSLTYKRLAEDNATVSSVLEAMREHSWVHFACHATQNPAEPTSSAFYLHDGPLDLAEITKKTLPNASFAFLSACQTALGDENLPDESIHLAAGLNMAGYPTLIATMWSIKDEHGPIVADHVYAALFRDGIADSSKVAVALHKAGHYLRAQVGEKDFSSWVPFIHIGL